MPGTARTRQATAIIIPERPTQVEAGHAKPGSDRHKPRLLTVLLSLLALLTLLHFIAVTHSAIPAALPNNCLGLLRSSDYARLVHLQAQQEMGAVQFTNQLDGGQPAALVEVTTNGTKQKLDVYMYGCSMQKRNTPTLVSLFTQRGLVDGTASISSANTLITSELDTTLSPQTLALAQPLQQNIYREYRWQHNRFIQITFPGLYPVSSSSEAQALQQQANNGQPLPWSDPLATAQQMAKDIFRWTTTSPQDAVLQNNGVLALVQLEQENSQLRVTVTLQRLLQHDKQGLWFVTAAGSGGITSAQPPAGGSITSPAPIQGSGALVNGETTAMLFDHTLTPVNLLNNPTLNVTSNGSYAGTLFYKSGAAQQPGLLLIQSLPKAGNSAAGQLLLRRVILG